MSQETEKDDDSELTLDHKSNDSPESYTGFDSVVKKDRQQRKTTFGPNSVKVKKPNNILIDIYGVICPWNFVHDLKRFARENMSEFIRDQWNSKLVRTVMARIREQVAIDRKAGTADIPEVLPENSPVENDVIESAIKCIQWLMDKKHKTLKSQIDRLCAELWSRSYDNGRLKVQVYPDVPEAFQYWRFEEFIKIYSYASGAVEGQRQFLRSTIYGDLNRYIANGLNSSGGYKFDANKFRSVCAALRESRPENLLYITDDPKKAFNAQSAGMRALVVNRTETTTGKFDPNETKGLPVVTNLKDIEFVADPHAVSECC